MRRSASAAAAASLENTRTRPASSTSTLVPVAACSSWIVRPPEPIRSRIRSGRMRSDTIRGARGDSCGRGPGSTSAIFDRMCSRPARACSSAPASTSSGTAPILLSIWIAVTPSAVPVTLKSMSPRWSSSPRMSDSTTKRPSSAIMPIAMPATGRTTGTPASIRARQPPQTVAIEDDPFDSEMSDTRRTVYGKASGAGSTAASARCARLPCPISRRPGPRSARTSPTEEGGKL